MVEDGADGDRERDPLRPVQVEAWPRPKGYENGVCTAGGEGERVLFVAGQVGWNPLTCTFATDDLVAQFAQTLDNVLAVVRAAGGSPQSVARMTVYIVDLEAYRGATKAIGQAWKERFGRHFPAMALVGVAGLLERRAQVEIEATCIVRGGSP